MVITSYVLVLSKYEENSPYPRPLFAKMYSPTLFSLIFMLQTWFLKLLSRLKKKKRIVEENRHL